MSTVVVVKKNGRAAIAADTLTSGSRKLSAKYHSEASKIVRLGKSYFGVTGSSVHRLVLEHLFNSFERSPRFSTTQEIFEVFRDLHPRLKQDYFVKPSEDERDPYESSRMNLLIANCYGIFGIYSLRETFEYERFWATGSGCEYALGAMHAVYDEEVDAQRIAEAGVKAAIDFDEATDGPIVSEVVPLTQRDTTETELSLGALCQR